VISDLNDAIPSHGTVLDYVIALTNELTLLAQPALERLAYHT